MVQFTGLAVARSVLRCATLAGHINLQSSRSFTSSVNLRNLLVDKRSSGVALITYVVCIDIS